MTDNTCPRCGMKDQVQKVSSVYSSGKSETTVSGPTSGHGFMSGISITKKAVELSPPPKPIKKGGFGCIILSIIALFGLSGVLGIISLIFGFSDNMIPPEYSWLIFVYLGIAIGGYLLHMRKKAQGETQYNRKLPIWERAKGIWDRLYYCQRDDVVYIPGTDNYAQANSMDDLLYP